MSHPSWSSGELEELSREAKPSRFRAEAGQRWLAVAFVIGVLLVLGLGFGTDVFDSGPTDSDVNDAYRDGLAVGESTAEAEWEERLEAVWWENYDRGTAEANSMSPSMQRAVIDGFSWESGFATGWESVEAGVTSPFLPDYWRGWIAGFEYGHALADGTAQPPRSLQTPKVEGSGET